MQKPESFQVKEPKEIHVLKKYTLFHRRFTNYNRLNISPNNKQIDYFDSNSIKFTEETTNPLVAMRVVDKLYIPHVLACCHAPVP